MSSAKVAKRVKFKRQPQNLLRRKFPAVSFSGAPTLSEKGFDLLARMLTYDPAQRITAAEAARHPWFDEVPRAAGKTRWFACLGLGWAGWLADN